MTRHGRFKLSLFIGLPLAAILLLLLLWRWDWFIPLVEARASAALGRPVTIAHLHVQLGRRTRLLADDVVVQNPPDFPKDVPPLARIAQLGVTVDVMAYLHHRILSVPLIAVKGPAIELRGLPDGRNNYTLALRPPGSPKAGQTAAPAPKLGDLTIEAGQLHADIPKLRADVTAGIETAPAEGVIAQHGQASEIRAEARGRYAGQPIRLQLRAGALLSVTDKEKPFPIDLHVENGATRVALAGTVQNPLAFAGTDLDLTLQGADMSDLYPLTGIPIPATPAYKVTGKLNYETATQRIRFDDVAGVVGNSDIEGTIVEAPQGAKPDVTMDLSSRRVDLADLGGFLGTNPGRATTKNATSAERRAAATGTGTGTGRTGRLIPSTPINMPRLNAANMHVHYIGHRIEGRNIPLDSLIVTMDLVDGAIDLHPVIFTVGKGRVQGNVSIAPANDRQVALKADLRFEQVDVSRLMAATHAFQGAGAIGGRATLQGTGNSAASLLASGNGGLALYMSGGSLSALLIDLSGLEFGKALLSALGLPRQTEVSCMISDFALKNGLVTTQALLVDTGEALISGRGTLDLRSERLDFATQTRSKNFSIGNLPAPITITGTLAHPAIGIGVKELAVRGGLATALGFLAAPLAILPTIDFGVGDPHKCGALVAAVKSQAERGTPGQKVPGTPVLKK